MLTFSVYASFIATNESLTISIIEKTTNEAMWLGRLCFPFHNKETSVPIYEVPTLKNSAKGEKKAKRDVPAVPASVFSTSSENGFPGSPNMDQQW